MGGKLRAIPALNTYPPPPPSLPLTPTADPSPACFWTQGGILWPHPQADPQPSVAMRYQMAVSFAPCPGCLRNADFLRGANCLGQVDGY